MARVGSNFPVDRLLSGAGIPGAARDREIADTYGGGQPAKRHRASGLAVATGAKGPQSILRQ